MSVSDHIRMAANGAWGDLTGGMLSSGGMIVEIGSVSVSTSGLFARPYERHPMSAVDGAPEAPAPANVDTASAEPSVNSRAGKFIVRR
jgi:hypothetical protein